MTSVRKILIGTGMMLTVVVLLAATSAAQMPQTATQQTKGAGTVTTEEMSGEVLFVEGNNLVVKMSNGEIKTFSNVPDSRRAVIDGKEVGVRDLKPGTKLNATIATTTTPVTVRTTTVGTGQVVFLAGTSVVLRLPNGENKQYNVKPDYKFTVNGRPATVFDLRPGMTVSAEKIVEAASVEITSDRKVVGQAPAAVKAQPALAQAPVAAPAPAPAAARVAAPTPAPPAMLPKTGSPVFLMGLLGLLLVGGSGAIGLLRRS